MTVSVITVTVSHPRYGWVRRFLNLIFCVPLFKEYHRCSDTTNGGTPTGPFVSCYPIVSRVQLV